jgi:glutathione S-transferase
MSLTLYDYEMDEDCYRVKLLLDMLGLERTSIAVNMFPKRQHLTPEILALDPAGTMPILRDGDLTLAGAGPILLHLARSYDASGTLLPADPAAFGAVIRWIGFSDNALAAAFDLRLVSMFDLPGDVATLKATARRAFRAMEDHMTLRHIAGSEWFVGDGATLADIALFPSFALSRDYDVGHEDYPALRRWTRRFRSLKGFRTMPGIPDYH